MEARVYYICSRRSTTFVACGERRPGVECGSPGQLRQALLTKREQAPALQNLWKEFMSTCHGPAAGAPIWLLALGTYSLKDTGVAVHRS